MAVNLFSRDLEVGTFKGFTESGLEFAAEIVAPYHPSEELTPRTGQLLLVELGTPEEAILGRITRFVPVGVMAAAEGDEYLASLSRLGRAVPEQLKEDRLRYNVRVKLLGGLKANNEEQSVPFKFVPSVRKLPHLGARVAYPSPRILSFLCRLGAKEAVCDTEIGHYALGEVIYNGGQEAGEDFFITMSETVAVHFDIHSLVGKRTFVFARAGYGKSNLMKFLLSELYRTQPTITLRGAARPVGTLIFDPEGEYFWPDENGRPGLCDVPHLSNRLALFTNRVAPNPYYGSWKAGNVRLDLRRCPPSEVVSLCISPDRQEHQNVIKIRTISRKFWPRLIDLLFEQEYQASDEDVRRATGIANLADVECNAMRSNLIPIIRTLHDPESELLRVVKELLRSGRIVVVDVSLVSGQIGLQVAGLLLNDLFYNNQASFTDPERGGLIPAIAVLEEAQSVLGKSARDDSPFVQWTKEGRKYNLGAMLVTQQPGSIAPELLSQGDNFFAFHLLSAHDLKTLQYHNAHFSDDVLAHLLNEPIRGNAYFWSAPHQPFVLPCRIRSFEKEYGDKVADRDRAGNAVNTGLSEVMTAEQRMITRLAGTVREIVQNGIVSIEGIEGDDTAGLVYKPRLSACVGEKMSDQEKINYCSGGDDGKTFVNDSILDQIVCSTGFFADAGRMIKGIREGETNQKDFYKIPSENFPSNLRMKGKVRILDNNQ